MQISPDNRVFIHIGMHKTASTFLQRQYFQHLQGVKFYAEPKFYDRLGTYSIENKFLISSEGLSGVAWNQEWKNGRPNAFHWMDSFRMAVENVKLIHPGATIIIVFRKHGDLLISMYKQYIQEGGILPFELFYGDHGIIREEDLSYEARWKFLTANFENVYALSFEQFKAEGVAYFDRFFAFLGLERPAESGIRLEKRNESITGAKVEMLRKINPFYRYIPAKAQKILQMLGCTPRQVFQKRLAFWKPADAPVLTAARKEVNAQMEGDWKYISEVFYAGSNS
jgi:hypothetical protein